MGANSWTVKNIVKGKSILFVIITLILTKIFYELANKGLNVYLNQSNDHPLYTPNYSFGKYGLLLIIPAAILTIIILKIYIKIRNKPYQNESDLSPANVRNFKDKITSVLSSKISKYVLILIGVIFLIFFIINFSKFITYFFPNIETFILRQTIMPAMYLILAIYAGSIVYMAKISFSKNPMNLSSKYAARCGLLALILLLTGFGALFAIAGIIFSIFGIINDRNEGRKTAIYGLLSSFMALLVTGGIVFVGYLNIIGKI